MLKKEISLKEISAYLTSISQLWRFQMKPRVVAKKCITDEKQFKLEYEKYITLLQGSKKK